MGMASKQVGDGAPPGSPALHSPPLGPGTIRAHRRGKAPARWRGQPWSPPETPAASASHPRSAKHPCSASPCPGEGDTGTEHPRSEHPRALAPHHGPRPSHTGPHHHCSLSLPVKSSVPAAREEHHRGCNATLGTWISQIQGSCIQSAATAETLYCQRKEAHARAEMQQGGSTTGS